MLLMMLMMRIWSPGLTVAEGGVVLILLGGSRAYIVSPSLPLKVSGPSPKFDTFWRLPNEVYSVLCHVALLCVDPLGGWRGHEGQRERGACFCHHLHHHNQYHGHHLQQQKCQYIVPNSLFKLNRILGTVQI